MNHDYAHCLDYREDCPEDCFRAQLARDLEANGNLTGVWLSWMHLKGTEECLKKAVTAMKPKNLNDLIRIEDAIRVLCRKTCTPGAACPDIYCKEMWEEFEDAERVDAVPVVTGTWKAVTDDGENYKRICTCCGKEAPFDELEGVYLIYPHCPHCGARMDGKGGDGNEAD